MTPLVGIIMGSESDLEIMKGAAEMLRQFEVEPELTIVSAHRTPQRLREYASKAKDRGLKVIIAGRAVQLICPAWWLHKPFYR